MIKTPEQLKGAIRNLAKKKGIHAQEVLLLRSTRNTAIIYQPPSMDMKNRRF